MNWVLDVKLLLGNCDFWRLHNTWCISSQKSLGKPWVTKGWVTWAANHVTPDNLFLRDVASHFLILACAWHNPGWTPYLLLGVMILFTVLDLGSYNNLIGRLLFGCQNACLQMASLLLLFSDLDKTLIRIWMETSTRCQRWNPLNAVVHWTHHWKFGRIELPAALAFHWFHMLFHVDHIVTLGSILVDCCLYLWNGSKEPSRSKNCFSLLQLLNFLLVDQSLGFSLYLLAKENVIFLWFLKLQFLVTSMRPESSSYLHVVCLL